jgi:hypothetical protein
MERKDFDNAITEIFGFFRMSYPSSDVRDAWFDKVSFIPGSAFGWIVNQIENEDNLPRNLPKMIIGQWHEYRRSNPSKSIQLQEDCDECGSTGLLHFNYNQPNYYQLKPMKIWYVAICAKCKNSHRHFGKLLHEGGRIKETGTIVEPVWRTTKAEIIRRGGEVFEMRPDKKIIRMDVNALPQIQSASD